MGLVKIIDHAGRALGRLASEFRDKARLAAILNAISSQVQDVEEVYYALLTERWADVAVGAQLDMLGRIVGQRRGGDADDLYRARITARIRANNSHGTPEDLLVIFRLLTGATPATLTLVYMPPAMFVLQITDFVMPPDWVSTFLDFLFDAKAAGVGAHLLWQEDVDAEMFYTELSMAIPGATVIGQMSIPVTSTAGMPASGSCVINTGLADTETRPYTVGDATHINIGGAGLVANHDAGSMAYVVGSVGKGWGSDANAALGGKFAGAMEV